MQPYFILRLLAIILISAGCANASPTDPKSGTDYMLLDSSDAIKSEYKSTVVEFFAYFCPHCNALELPLQDWVKKNGSNIQFERVPLSYGNKFAAQQRLYYAIAAMGKTNELHKRIFDEIHIRGNRLNDDESIIEFIAKQGINKKAFRDIYYSSGVDKAMARANALQKELNVGGVPALLVDGRYLTKPGYFHKKINFFDYAYMSIKKRLGIENELDAIENNENASTILVVDYLAKKKAYLQK
jgi:thiol:disulfide interchange protein DsbA